MDEELLQLGINARQAGNREAALRYFEKVIQTNPNHLNAHVEVGIELVNADRVSEAKEKFYLVLDRDKNNVQALLGLGDCFLKEGRFVEALKIFNTGLKAQAKESSFYEATSRAFLSCLLSHSRENIQDLNSGEDFDKDKLLEQLILQTECLDDSFHFLKILAVYYSQATNEDILIKTAQVLTPILKRLYETERINKNFVLILIYLRKFINDLISDKDISELHKKYFCDFNVEDIKLPYNFSFRGEPFLKNKRDLKEFSASLSSRLDAVPKLELYHLLFLAWLDRTRFKLLHNDEILLNILRTKLGDSNLSQRESNQSAGRSLLLRYLKEDSISDTPNLSSVLDSLSCTEEYLRLMEETRMRRTGLMQSKVEPDLNVLKYLMQTRIYQGFNVLKYFAQAKAHRSFNISRKLKVAVCISGQLRGFRRAFPSWIHTLLLNIDYDIFVHTWQRIGRSEPSPTRVYKTFEGKRFSEAYKACCTSLSYQEVKKRYPSLFRFIEDSGNITKEEIAEVYKTDKVIVEDEKGEQFYNFSNSDKMHYKIYACHQYALSQGQEYDLYIRVRPDKPISLIGFDWQDTYRRCKAEPLIFADGGLNLHYAQPAIGDQFAVGVLDTMSIYSYAWKFNPVASSQGLLNWPSSFAGHVTLAQTCWTHGISVEKIPVRWLALLDPDSLPMESVLEKIRLDAGDRMDRFDSQLISALEADLRAE